ncbi:MAG TPA: hypothetical protein DCG47_10450 [Spirochaetaceae bacterium]|nr:hypothetical protein [Spirochaetaceae bacterium]
MSDLLRKLPPIRRIRGNRLYAEDGRRLLDLWLDDGRGILGDAEKAAKTYASNAIDKGLLRPYPGLYERRFIKAVQARWPGYPCVRLYTSEESALRAAHRILGARPLIIDTAAREAAIPEGQPGAQPQAALTLLRPFLDTPAGARASPRLALPRLPCPRPYAPACLLSADAALSDPGELVPGMQLYAATRALDSLANTGREGYTEERWRLFDKRMGLYFERRGPYLYARVTEDEYEGFFMAALQGGALISPIYAQPSIVAPDIDDGELKKLAAALAAFRAAR